jgi:hypothetical protein
MAESNGSHVSFGLPTTSISLHFLLLFSKDLNFLLQQKI